MEWLLTSWNSPLHYICIALYLPVNSSTAVMRSLDHRRKGIALAEVSAVEPAPEPGDPLGRGAVGEAVRHYLTAAAFLQAVIANC